MIGTSRSAPTPVLVLAGQLAVPAAFHGLNPDRPTFVDDIAPILHENCASCHQPGEIGPMALRTWSEVRPAGTRMEVVAHWDNSAGNPNNPDPTADVGFGVESTDEMMVGFVDFVAAEGVSPRPASPVIAVLTELARTHPGEAWRVDTERYRGKGPEPTALLLPRGGGPGQWFGGEPGNRVVASPVNDIVWDGNRVTATVGRGPTAKIEGLLQEDGSLLLDLSATGGGAEVRGTPAENETPRTLPNG